MSQFTVRPFAFMRLTHEALRAGFQELVYMAEGHAPVEELRARYAALARVIALHARQEEEVFFPILDAVADNAVTKAGLRDTHEHEEDNQAAVEAALKNGDIALICATLQAWAPDFESHLAEEEAVMMPLTRQVADTLEGRAAAVRHIMAVDWQELMEAHLPYVTRALGQTKPYGPVRMFVAAVQAASGERYAEIEPILMAALPLEVVMRLGSHGHFSGSWPMDTQPLDGVRYACA